MRFERLKRHYLDLRLGGVTVNPLIQAGNFTMITFMLVKDNISFFIFAPLFLLAVFFGFTLAGFFFRRIQLSTDEDLKYEKQKELNKTLFEIMTLQKKIAESKSISIDNSFHDRLKDVKNIIK